MLVWFEDCCKLSKEVVFENFYTLIEHFCILYANYQPFLEVFLQNFRTLNRLYSFVFPQQIIIMLLWIQTQQK